MNIHGVEIEVKENDSHTLKEIIRGWENHETDFKEMRHSVDHDPNYKIYIGDAVFERRDGKYILRKSSKSY